MIATASTSTARTFTFAIYGRGGRIALESALSNFRMSAFRSSSRSRSSSARTPALTRLLARENEASLSFFVMRVL